ncbi:hypothetical protein [Moraxella oblonga]|uniref:hypothetical protein n=1 Tax=Moraxella oblonga TaxID=200413 RepID=UPI00157AE7D0|nr:hypothetical protein [Moraxella oblonga]
MKKLLKLTLANLGVLTLSVAILGILFYRNLGDLPDESRFHNLPYYKNGQFTNLHADDLPYYPEQATGKGCLIRHDAYTPKARLPMILLDKSSFRQPENFAYYWLGHASSILELDGHRFLTDPVFDNATPLNLPLIVPKNTKSPLMCRKWARNIQTVL